MAESDTVDSYKGDDTKGVYGWGTQLELGALSSYIPTTTVSVTRLGEDAPVATSDWDFSATVGSLYGVVVGYSLNISNGVGANGMFGDCPEVNGSSDQDLVEL